MSGCKSVNANLNKFNLSMNCDIILKHYENIQSWHNVPEKQLSVSFFLPFIKLFTQTFSFTQS